MSSGEFYIVDVFAEEAWAGNQLAVFTRGEQYGEADLQRLARETNFSETTFIYPTMSTSDTYKVRIFTPTEEVPFAGHPTLGTSYVIARYLSSSQPSRVVLDLPVGPIPVDIQWADNQPGILTMRQRFPDFGVEIPTDVVLSVLPIEKDDIDPRYPIQIVSTGLPFIIVPLRSLDALKRCVPNPAVLSSVFATYSSQNIFLFCPETHELGHALAARMFTPILNTLEDPATGSANGCLIAYLLYHNYLGTDDFSIQVEQGYEMGRPSLLYLQGRKEGKQYEILVGGRVNPVAHCRLLT